jgi:hypothetical protein
VYWVVSIDTQINSRCYVCERPWITETRKDLSSKRQNHHGNFFKSIDPTAEPVAQHFDTGSSCKQTDTSHLEYCSTHMLQCLACENGMIASGMCKRLYELRPENSYITKSNMLQVKVIDFEKSVIAISYSTSWLDWKRGQKALSRHSVSKKWLSREKISKWITPISPLESKYKPRSWQTQLPKAVVKK